MRSFNAMRARRSRIIQRESMPTPSMTAGSMISRVGPRVDRVDVVDITEEQRE
jgi:hypothetical protein